MAFSHRTQETGAGLSASRKGRGSVADFKAAAKKAKLKPAPPELTNAENFYYLKQMNSKTPMVIVMNDGEEIHGWIEWYDKNSLKVNREGAPNLLIQKHWIKYLFKADELENSPR